MSTSVIVFGATGNVGAITAQTAQEHGAKVWLAMRDPSKTIPGLTPEQEQAGGYERVQADLTKPDTISAAVQKSGAKHAFIYVAPHGSDMKDALEALKSSGITFVVLLSSFTIYQPLREILPQEVIPYVHAKVEISLEEVFGTGNFVALRPGGFATNSLRYKQGIQSGTLKLFGGTFKQDGITPDDMGRVGGIILAKGAQNGEHIVYLYGPKLHSQEEMAKIIAKQLDKDIKIVPQTADEAREEYTAHGLPAPVIEYMVTRLAGDDSNAAPRVRFEEGVANVQKYTGRPSLGFEEWVSQNKHLFT